MSHDIADKSRCAVRGSQGLIVTSWVEVNSRRRVCRVAGSVHASPKRLSSEKSWLRVISLQLTPT